MASITLSVVAPDRTVVETETNSVIAPGTEGYLGVQAGHIPMIVSLTNGLLEYQTPTGKEYVAVQGGFMEISDNKVIVIADHAQAAADIDLKEAEQELEEARKALRGESSTMTSQDATAAIERAMTRIRAARMKS
jgi:F-type H+-transporting ATPase subunit epsilon